METQVSGHGRLDLSGSRCGFRAHLPGDSLNEVKPGGQGLGKQSVEPLKELHMLR